MANSINWLSATGIAWDISGAFALSRGYFFASKDQIARQFGSFYGGNPSAYRAFFEQREEHKLGFFQLLVGFFLQALAALGVNVAVECSIGILFLAGVGWLFHLTTYVERAALNALKLKDSRKYAEETLRTVHYYDLSDLQWERLKVNNALRFKDDEQ